MNFLIKGTRDGSAFVESGEGMAERVRVAEGNCSRHDQGPAVILFVIVYIPTCAQQYVIFSRADRCFFFLKYE